ncbi:MAG: permease-like cell division protein FtsX [Lachnospiraceae bacterium]|nr:permease-like cell division protein FtsX [Lachnospiraceae bacterium]
MKEEKWINAIEEITMPENMKEDLLRNCQNKVRTKNPLFRYSRLITAAAVIMAVLITMSFPAYAAYDLHQTKNLAIFFEEGISYEEIEAIGNALSGMEEISSVYFTNPDEAWIIFSEKYMDEAWTAFFSENPLKDSANYRVTVKLNADTEKVRNKIEQIAGVRKITNLYELDEME